MTKDGWRKGHSQKGKRKSGCGGRNSEDDKKKGIESVRMLLLPC